MSPAGSSRIYLGKSAIAGAMMRFMSGTEIKIDGSAECVKISLGPTHLLPPCTFAQPSAASSARGTNAPPLPGRRTRRAIASTFR
jgi:hypothetical protein